MDSSSHVQGLGVDLARRTGAVHGGATGMLYGMSDDGVPAGALLAGANPHTIAQMAPGGEQHPNGDALTVADAFLASGGQEILVYMQDVYRLWPYEDKGIDDYLAKVEAMVTTVAASPHADAFAWVPFNEPDWIWYGDWATDRDRFVADWTSVYHAIRSILPHARIVGPNEMTFNPDRVRDFLLRAKERRVLPDVMSWHELTPEGLSGYRAHFTAYRALERSLGISPLPITINEYGNRRDLSNPGQVVQWISLFEDTKVDADMAYWTYAGNLDDHAVQSGQANGGWWLLKWYADLTGETVQVRSPAPDVADTLQATAAIDVERRQATVLFGGTAADVRLELTGVDLATFGDVVDVVVSKTSWSGYEGDATRPPVLSRSRRAITGGALSVHVEGGDPMAAYQVQLTPAERDADTARAPWTVRVEAEDAVLTAARVFVQDDDPQKYATSGGRDVGALTSADSAVSFTVDVPRSGAYVLGAFYGTDGAPARLALYLDGSFERLLVFGATLSWTYRGRLDVPIELTAGTHTLSLRTTGPDGMIVDSDVTLDRFDLTREVAPETSTYPARVARLSGGASLRTGGATRPAAAVLAGGASATFFVAAAATGYYDLAIQVENDGTVALVITLDARTVQAESLDQVGRWCATARVHLARGITAVRVHARTGTVSVTAATLTRVASADLATVSVDAEGATLSGGALLERATYAAAGAYVSHLGSGPGAMTVARGSAVGAGAFNLAVSYANAAKNDASHYNTDVISRSATIWEAGQVRATAWFRHTYAWNNFWTLVVPLELTTADGDLTLGNPVGPAPHVDHIGISRLVLSTRLDRAEP